MREFPGSPVVGAGAPSAVALGPVLVRELRSHKPQGMAKNTKKENRMIVLFVFFQS